jgi:hypothetical protein
VVATAAEGPRGTGWPDGGVSRLNVFLVCSIISVVP